MSDSSVQSTAPLLGTEVAGRYRVESLLHERDDRLTYQATCLRTGRPVMMILPSQRLWEDPGSLQRFFQGARAASGLKHPGILSVNDVGESSAGIPFLVTDLVRGTTVSAMLMDQGRPPLLRLVNIARGVAQGLAAAHKKGVAQWNLAPCYVLVASGVSGPDQVRLLDLGLTQRLKPVKGAPQVTDEFRTQPYAAPLAAANPYVPLDALAFGGLLFSMATGSSPGSGKVGKVDEEVLRSALCEREGTGSEQRARQKLVDLTLRCLADSPAARPRSMDEIDRKLGSVEESIGLGLMERSLLAPLDGETEDGVPMEPIDTIEQVNGVAGSGESKGPVTRGNQWHTRRVAIAAIALALFGAGLVVGLLFNR